MQGECGGEETAGQPCCPCNESAREASFCTKYPFTKDFYCQSKFKTSCSRWSLLPGILILSNSFVYSTVQQTFIDNMDIDRKTQSLFLRWSQFKWKNSIKQATTMQSDKCYLFIHLAHIFIQQLPQARHCRGVATQGPCPP